MDIPLHERLGGQVALVSGANRGIGAQVAADLAALGCIVYAGARDPSQVAEGENVRPVRLDVTDLASMDAAVQRIQDEVGRLDVLVNNAAVVGDSGPLHELDVKGLCGVLGTNIRGPMLLSRAALPLLLERSGGRLVNLSSGMGALGEGMSGGYPAYRMSKAAINGLTAYLHGEYAGQGLLANSVCPGWVRTDMGGPGATRSIQEGADTPVWLCRFQEGAPSGRFWRDRKVIDW